MAKECDENLLEIVHGFQKCRNAFTAIGDETRQLILLVLLESDLSGIRVGEIAQKAHLTRPSVSPPSANIKGIRDCCNAERGHEELLLFKCRRNAVERDC